MTNSIFDPVACISRERDATRNFIDILRQEQAALQQPGASLLLSIANEKAHQAQQLAQLSDARNYWLRKFGYTQDHIGMERGLRDYPAAVDAWEELLQLAETASQLNKINGILSPALALHPAERSRHSSPLPAAPEALVYTDRMGSPSRSPAGVRLGEV